MPAGLTLVLSRPSMWDQETLKHPAAVPMLTIYLSWEPPMRDAAIRLLGIAGKAAAQALPVMFGLLLVSNEPTRLELRQALNQIDPGWKKHPALATAMVKNLYAFTNLPAAEVDELGGSLANMTPKDGEILIDAIKRQLAELNRGHRGRLNEKELVFFTKSLDLACSPLDKLARHLSNSKPALMKLLDQFTFTYYSGADSRNTLITARLIKALQPVLGESKDLVTMLVEGIQGNDAVLGFLKGQGKRGLVAIEGLIGQSDKYRWLVGLRAAAFLGKDAVSLRGKILSRLGESGRTPIQLGVEGELMLAEVVSTLNVIDPNWWSLPEAVPGLADLFRYQGAVPSQKASQRRELVLKLMLAAGPMARDVVAPLAIELLTKGGLDEGVMRNFDKIDANWRSNAEVGKAIPLLVAKMKDIDQHIERLLQSFGTVAVAELVKALPDGNDGQKRALRSRILVVLKQIGPPAKEAVPGVLKHLANASLSQESLQEKLAALAAIDPAWATDMQRKEAVAQLLGDILKKAETDPKWYSLVSHIGTPAVASLVQLLNGKAPARASILGALGGMGGQAMLASKEVLRLVADKDPEVRLAAIQALGRISRAEPSLAGVLLGGLLDRDSRVVATTGVALEQVAPGWRTHPKCAEVKTQAIKLLSHREALMRYNGLGALETLGPTPEGLAAVTRLLGLEKEANTRRRAEQVLQKFLEKK